MQRARILHNLTPHWGTVTDGAVTLSPGRLAYFRLAARVRLVDGARLSFSMVSAQFWEMLGDCRLIGSHLTLAQVRGSARAHVATHESCTSSMWFEGTWSSAGARSDL